MDTSPEKFIGFRADQELSKSAKIRAKNQNRSLAGYLRNLVQEDLESSIIREDPSLPKRLEESGQTDLENGKKKIVNAIDHIRKSAKKKK